jgi:hypothetical protein
VLGPTASGATPASARPIAVGSSAPLSAVLTPFLKRRLLAHPGGGDPPAWAAVAEGPGRRGPAGR